MNNLDRRTFVKQASTTVAGFALAGRVSSLWGAGPPSDRVRAAVMGVNSRGNELAKSIARLDGLEVAHVCDVDRRAMEKTIADVSGRRDGRAALQASTPKGATDFRRALDDPEVDALVIAAPDHWHAPAALLALQAGKHVYVEKPCGHNPREGELLVEAQRKYGRVVQMGNQQRSSPETIQIIRDIRDGVIGKPYFARAWYANTRGSIGRGRPAAVPDWLDYELWQGPAPRTPYRDNVVHYNWHWFWRWGTGEICNNGTHEIDVCRWALDVDFPTSVSSAGGRYHFDDDWEFYDTQVASFNFDGGRMITWEGRSCNGTFMEGRGRGASIHGTDGTAIIDRDGYVVYDNDRNEIWRRTRPAGEAGLDTRGGGSLTDLHLLNFAEAIRGNAEPTAPIHDGHKSVLLCHLGNIAQHTGRTLHCNPENGHIVDNAEAMKMWARAYEPGWEMKV